MKVAIAMLQFLPLCFLLLSSFNTTPLAASEPVLDDKGNPLDPAVGYYVWPLWTDRGGLTLGQTRNKTCPLDVIRDPSFIGSPVFFNGPDFEYVPTQTALIVDFQAGTICNNQSTVWRLSKEGSGLWFVSTNGNPQDFTSNFKIEKLQGEHACPIYSFKFCPSVPGALCAPVGTYVDADGTKVMAVGDNIEPYYVRFQQAFYDPKKIQAVSNA